MAPAPAPAAAGRAAAAAPIVRRIIAGPHPRSSLLRASSSWSSPLLHLHHHQRQQQRWAQVHDVRFIATTQASRHILEKYRDKLDRKARAEGYTDIDELKKAYEDKIQGQRRRDAAAVPGLGRAMAAVEGGQRQENQTASPPTPPPPPSSSPTSTITPPPKPKSTYSTSQVKPLSSILDLPKARTLPVPELTAIWRLRHSHLPNTLCAVIPAQTYDAMVSLARQRPQFLLPVPHQDQGAELHFLQWTFDAATGTSTVLFTQLAEYKARGEFAAPHTTVTHHPDLAAEKGVVLMQGTVAEDRGVKVADAQWLVMCLQRFYGGWAAGGDGKGPVDVDERAVERRKLLEWFSAGDQRFTVEKLLEETERLG